MEYLVGGAVALAIVLYVKFRNFRTLARNNDPHNMALLLAVAENIRGDISNDQLVIRVAQIRTDASHAVPPVAGDVWSKRIVHVSTMFPWYTSLSKEEIRRARKLLYDIAL